MPPLAVVGYGLATATWPIAGGAFLLFLTNVVSILGAVFGVARRYGFRPRAREGAAWETPALLAVMLLLCVPLAVSLRSIVAEARETTRARTAINEAFAGAAPHITELKVDLQGKASLVQCVVVTRKYVPGAAQAIAKLLHPGSKVEVEQIVTAEGVSALAPPAAALGARTTVQATSTTPEQRLRAMLGPLGQVLGIEASDGALDIAFAMPGAELADYLATEQAAQRFSPGTTVRLIPPLAPLSPIAFAPGSSELTPEANRTLEIDAWALKRWGAAGASITAADSKLAKARAEAVALGLRARGVAAVSVAEPSKDGPADTVAIQPAPAA